MVTVGAADAAADGRFDVFAAACPTRQVIGRIGDKWSLLTLYALMTGSLRFTELRARIEGVSQKMLTQTLRALERDGLVSRRVYPVVPPKVEYSVTELGMSLGQEIAGIRAWAYAHMDDISEARERFDGSAQVS